MSDIVSDIERRSEMKRRLASFDIDAQKGFTPICPEELPVPEGDRIVSALEEMAYQGAGASACKASRCP